MDSVQISADGFKLVVSGISNTVLSTQYPEIRE